MKSSHLFRSLLPGVVLAVPILSMACLSLSGGAPGTVAPQPIVFGPGPFDLTDTKAGLAGLSSYTASLKLDFDGVQAGQAGQWSTTTVMIVSQQAAARQLTIHQAGDAAPGLFLAEEGGVVFERRGDSTCTAAAAAPGYSPLDLYDPAGSLSPIVGAEEAGSETVNGIAADHYTFDERALARSGFTSSSGEVWVAVDGGYIVKFLLTTQAGPEYFGADTEGTSRWEYELTAINETVAAELPPDCPAGLVDVPRLPDAENVLSLPGVLTYDSLTPAAQAGAFYQDALPGLGWQLADTLLITETSALLDFSQGHGRLTVIITSDQDHTAVRIVQIR